MKVKKLSILILFLSAFSVFSNIYNSEFVWDDQILIEHNPNIESTTNIKDIFTQPWGQYYRPMQELSLMLDTYIWGKRSEGYHISAVLIHFFSSLMLYKLLLLLGLESFWAFFVAMLFMVHPVNGMTVNYLSCRGGLLSVLFMLVSFYYYLISLNAKNNTSIINIFSTFFLMLALLSKEDALVFPGLLFLHGMFLMDRDLKSFETYKKSLISILPHIFSVIIYILFRLVFVSSSVNVASLEEMWLRVPGFFVAFSQYLRLLVYPVELRMSYGAHLFHWNDMRVVVGMMIFICYLLLIALFLNKKNNKVVFFLVWPLLMLLPGSNIFYPMAFFMSEILIYFPAIAWYVLFAYSINKWTSLRYKKLLKYLCVCLLIMCALVTHKNNEYWNDELNFYAKTLEKELDPRVVSLMIKKLIEDKEYEKAVSLGKVALELVPKEARLYLPYATALNALKRYDEAIEVLTKSLMYDDDDPSVYILKLLIELQDHENLDRSRQSLLEIKARFPDVYERLLETKKDMLLLHNQSLIELFE